VTPNELFYLRSNFPYPAPVRDIEIGGAVAKPRLLPVAELRSLPSRTLVATIECAGNGRAYMSPPVPGEPWGLGAVSTAEWTGVSLSAILGELRPEAVDVLFEAADGFARSLPLETATHPDTLLAFEMNGEPLPHEHGGPVRVLVPRWYGMASVKWVARVAGLEVPFGGHFQSERYVIESEPVREMNVRALITEPAAGSTVAAGRLTVRGYAWTGRGHIVAVDVSADGGASWRKATIVESAPPYAWSRWEVEWLGMPSGRPALVARASDSAGGVQPLEPVWNSLGYCNNGAVPHLITVA